MSSKFGHERRNRQERAWKEPGGCVGNAETPKLWEPVFTPDRQHFHLRLNHKLDLVLRRTALMNAFDARVRLFRFKVLDYRFVFAWTPEQFAKANGLSFPSAKSIFDKTNAEAEAKLHIVKQRLRRFGFSTYYDLDEAGNRVEVLSLDYRELWKFFQKDDGV